MKLTIYFLFVLVILALFFRISFASGQVVSKSFDKIEVEKYHLFEVSLRSDSTYENPYTQVALSALVIGPGGTEYSIDGYWQGGATWKLRIMPTMPGPWFYTTESNDQSLDNLSGEFECLGSTRPGILIANPDYPYTFKLSEGAPFFWMGETSWWLMSHDVSFVDSTFCKFINKRLDQKFNGIHFVLGTGGSPSGTKNPENEGGKLWLSQREQRINPEFFKWMDKRIAYLDSVQMAIGFYITWSQHFTTFSKEEFERFEKYLIARYSAYPLLYWIIVGEFDEAGKTDDYNYHGQIIDNSDAYGHLIAIHPNHHDLKNLGTNRIFAGQDWCDMIIQQLPQFPVWNSYDQVYQSVLADRIYNKPVVNVEYGYENRDYSGKIVTSDWVRKYAWSIICAGGFFSYGHDATIRTIDLTALESDGARYIGHLFDFFQNMKWWEFYPDTTKASYGYCLSNFLNESVIYLPDSGVIAIDFSGQNETFQAQWFNPIDGNYSSISDFEAGSMQSFRSIYDHDAVLHIWKYSAPPSYQLSGAITYYKNHGTVAGTILDLKSDKFTLSDTSNLTGSYIFENIIESNCELISKKNDDQQDEISGADALLLLQFLESQSDLTENQKIAADVTGEQTISASDAEAIINYLAFLNTQIGSTGQWKFAPDTAKFWLHSDTTIDFQAYLLGDVNGSWDQNKTISGSGNEIDTTATSLKIAWHNASSSRVISIPVAIDNLDMPFHTLLFSAKYNPDILKFISAQKTSASPKFILAANGNEHGKIHLAMVGIYEITQPGEIIMLNFEIINKNYRIFSTDLEILNARINDLKVAHFENGRIIFGKPRFVDVESSFFSIQNYPNPFNTATTISINLPIETDLKIVIFNTMGQTVKVLFDDKLKEGFHEMKWDGENETGEALPSGVYFFRIEC
ncbi:DUF4038 domain-containing protein, partial [candidate division KSB1 bacterium]|nr:DUF4038 domain-containing protein [candidate division KSB1 bacterium]